MLDLVSHPLVLPLCFLWLIFIKSWLENVIPPMPYHLSRAFRLPSSITPPKIDRHKTGRQIGCKLYLFDTISVFFLFYHTFLAIGKCISPSSHFWLQEGFSSSYVVFFPHGENRYWYLPYVHLNFDVDYLLLII